MKRKNPFTNNKEKIVNQQRIDEYYLRDQLDEFKKKLALLQVILEPVVPSELVFVIGSYYYDLVTRPSRVIREKTLSSITNGPSSLNHLQFFQVRGQKRHKIFIYTVIGNDNDGCLRVVILSLVTNDFGCIVIGGEDCIIPTLNYEESIIEMLRMYINTNEFGCGTIIYTNDFGLMGHMHYMRQNNDFSISSNVLCINPSGFPSHYGLHSFVDSVVEQGKLIIVKSIINGEDYLHQLATFSRSIVLDRHEGINRYRLLYHPVKESHLFLRMLAYFHV